MNQLEEEKTKEADEQASTKIRLEKEMQTLQKCMEEMKAVYNLNQEKLDFNYKVLKEKKQTSKDMINKLKNQERKKIEEQRKAQKRLTEQTDQ